MTAPRVVASVGPILSRGQRRQMAYQEYQARCHDIVKSPW
eukprot:CAMPEP_0171493740 /NCGR_PEP_ID=MMETSP0958-20121227/5130_1 /TAXON_ID=87120 /ORGANISM="Aurantiochytrium limacinum, Strain ATCCMYA-1381" /LENGTH=39 /DNA_ID= /DNA_START= /DNA_END= /DNA_ORIENTATION=